MGSAIVSNIYSKAKETGVLSSEDLLVLRRAVGSDLTIDPREAEILFQINDNCDVPEGWSEYFIGVITVFLVEQTPPLGYISDIQASWLLARINHDGVVETQTELGLLLSVLKTATNVTESLEAFALAQVERAVLEGKGHLARAPELTPGAIGEAEVDMLRRVLYASASEGGIGISRLEAEAVFNLNEATSGAPNCESWQRLYVCAIANHLMMSAAWEEPDFNEAMRRENWLQDRSKILDKSSFLDLDFNSIVSAFGSLFGADRPAEMTHMNAERNARAEKITEVEAGWLIQRLNRDGGIDANERALLDFLAQECPDIHSTLAPLVKAA